VGNTTRVVIDYAPRPAFLPLHNRTERFACIVAHRRAGKTVACVNDLLKGALTLKKENPRYAYIAPQYTQAKDVAWEYLKRFAAPVLAHGGGTNESELRVDLPNGGRVRLYGAENADRLRGLYFDGVILDEFATMDPRIWEVVRPALSDRNGWCVWIGTPQGHNEFHRIYERSKTEAGWLSMMMKASQTKILPETELDEARRDLTPEQFAREYECSFDAAIVGAYYGKDMEQAEAENRITAVPWDRSTDVVTAWDLGIGDSTAIWFAQQVGREIHLIDFIEHSGVGLDWYVKALKDKPYVYGEHLFPHDVEARELGTGKSRKEVLEALGIKVTLAPKLGVDDGISAARNILNRCWFDKTATARGVESLKQYRREWDDRGKVFKPKPLHDWTSHPADAFRYLATGLKSTSKPQWSDQVMNFETQWAVA
jgi:phage terminase large subunit